ncbi:MAG: response regulator [Terriglobia bacterium]
MNDPKTRGGKERRQKPRCRTRSLVCVELGGETFPLADLSATGTFIRTESPAAVGKELKLRLMGERVVEPIEVTAVVRRSEPGIGMGVEFTKFRESDQWRMELLAATLAVVRILVVDDDENLLRILKLAFEREEYEVETATDGVEGLQKALGLQPDLIILDLALPGMPGLEVCRRLRADSRMGQVPILILSATTDLAEVDTAQKTGAVMFAAKPFKPEKLLNYVRMLLDR